MFQWLKDKINRLSDERIRFEIELSIRESFNSKLMESFVQGAKWWEFHETEATMWQSDQSLAYKHAQKLLDEGRLGLTTEEWLESEKENDKCVNFTANGSATLSDKGWKRLKATIKNERSGNGN